MLKVKDMLSLSCHKSDLIATVWTLKRKLLLCLIVFILAAGRGKNNIPRPYSLYIGKVNHLLILMTTNVISSSILVSSRNLFKDSKSSFRISFALEDAFLRIIS